MPNYYGEDTKQHLRLWLKMLKTTGAIEGLLQARLKQKCQTTLPRFDVLAALDHHPEGLRMSELSKFIMVSNGNVTGIANRLLEEGLISRQADALDGRVQMLRLTNIGKQEFTAMAEQHAAWIDEYLAPIAGQDLEHFISLLDKVKNQLGDNNE